MNFLFLSDHTSFGHIHPVPPHSYLVTIILSLISLALNQKPKWKGKKTVDETKGTREREDGLASALRWQEQRKAHVVDARMSMVAWSKGRRQDAILAARDAIRRLHLRVRWHDRLMMTSVGVLRVGGGFILMWIWQ